MTVLGLSERFACRVTGQHRATQRRPPAGMTTADPDAAFAGLAARLGEGHPRRGFRNAYADARGEGWHVNHKRVQRLWRVEGLRVPQRRRRKRIGTSTTPDPPKADAPNRGLGRGVPVRRHHRRQTGQDRVHRGRAHPRMPRRALWDRSITGDRLIDELDRIALDRGYPAVVRCDNGPELACDAMADWAGERVALSFIPLGSPGATATSSRSTPGSATNASTSTSSGHSRTHVW
jgi:putative transposase